jgi:hypothetical protein
MSVRQVHFNGSRGGCRWTTGGVNLSHYQQTKTGLNYVSFQLGSISFCDLSFVVSRADGNYEGLTFEGLILDKVEAFKQPEKYRGITLEPGAFWVPKGRPDIAPPK